MLLTTCIGLLAVLTSVRGRIDIYNQSSHILIRNDIYDMPAAFGGVLPPDDMAGFLVNAEPSDGCTNMTKPPTIDNFTGKWMVLITKQNCTYELKIRNAQAAGFDLAIVHNVNSSELEVMTAEHRDGIDIPAVFVSDFDGLILSDMFVYDTGFYITVNAIPPITKMQALVFFLSVCGGYLLIKLIVMVVKYIIGRWRSRNRPASPARGQLPNPAPDDQLPTSPNMTTVPSFKFRSGDPYETCAICLDNYKEGERLCVLLCAHAYHATCIKPWLNQNNPACPLCKRCVTSDSDSDVTEPLLDESLRSMGGTFDEQSENPFARAKRFMARLKARIRNGDYVEVSSSPPEGNVVINPGDDEKNIGVRGEGRDSDFTKSEWRPFASDADDAARCCAKSEYRGNTDDIGPLIAPTIAAVSERRPRRSRRSRYVPSTRHSINQ